MDIAKLVDDYLVKNVENRVTEPHGVSCSGLDKCNRKIIYGLLRAIPSVPDPKFLKVLENGNAVHKRIQGYLRGMGILEGNFICQDCGAITKGISITHCSECKSFYLNYEETSIMKNGLSGRPDAIINKDGERYIGEIKSTKDRYFYSSPPWHYLYGRQIQAYMLMTGIKKAFLIYENKDNQAWKIIPIEYNPKEIKSIQLKIDTLRDYIKRKILPIRIPQNCKYCNYKTICDSNKTFEDIQKETKITFEEFNKNI